MVHLTLLNRKNKSQGQIPQEGNNLKSFQTYVNIVFLITAFRMFTVILTKITLVRSVNINLVNVLSQKSPYINLMPSIVLQG